MWSLPQKWWLLLSSTRTLTLYKRLCPSIDVWSAPAYIPGDSPPHQPTKNTQPLYDTTHTNITPLLITPNIHTTNRHTTPLLTPRHHSYHTPSNTNNHNMRYNASTTLYTQSQSLRPRIMGHHTLPQPNTYTIHHPLTIPNHTLTHH